jgi:adenosylcobyric acid synthase
VGDIDRGGVFASLFGTAELISHAEKALVKGFVINKFRGDASLLEPGFQFLQERTGIPTLGVIPYLKGWKGEEEDSLGLEQSLQHKPNAPLKICVIRLPFLSNYTDFDSLSAESDVNVVFVSSPNELENADAVIIPGTKSTMADLKWLHENGFHGALKVCLKRAIPVVGICGGYQMLGKTLSDPHGVESNTTHAEGLNFVNVHTEFLPEKRTAQAHGHTLSDAMGNEGSPLTGYEIHMGRTSRAPGVKPFCTLTCPSGSTTEDGAVSPDGLVVGTYLHGLFDAPVFRRTWLNTLRASKNLPPFTGHFSTTSDIDLLANHIASHVNMEAIRRIVFLPPENSRQGQPLAHRTP